MSEQEIFQLRNVDFSYAGEADTLKRINLQINAGEAVSILGANGCGKSTLLKIFAGLISPTSGDFFAFGTEVTARLLRNDSFANHYHQQVGFIFQDSDVQLFCNSVREELAFGLLQLDYSVVEINQRINEIIQLLGIEHLIDKAPYKLSGGEKKKVAIAAVLLLNPQVLILDEPTNALDPKSQAWLIELLRKLNLAGKTLIITTHNLNLVEQLTRRGVLLNEQHQIVADMPISDLLTKVELLRQVNLIL